MRKVYAVFCDDIIEGAFVGYEQAEQFLDEMIKNDTLQEHTWGLRPIFVKDINDE